jgi:hypothetical protein
MSLAVGPGKRDRKGRGAYNEGMAKFRGTIRRNDLEGGHFQLEAEDGTTYVLDGSDPALSKDGSKVEIDGAVDRQAMSFAMTGPVLKVRSVKAI